jgi:excisionase family DNA binding protein
MTGKLYTVTEVAEVFQVSEYTVREWCKNGTLDAVKPGKSWRVPESEVTRLAHERYGA